MPAGLYLTPFAALDSGERCAAAAAAGADHPAGTEPAALGEVREARQLVQLACGRVLACRRTGRVADQCAGSGPGCPRAASVLEAACMRARVDADRAAGQGTATRARVAVGGGYCDQSPDEPHMSWCVCGIGEPY